MRHVFACDARVHLGELVAAIANHGESIVIEQRGCERRRSLAGVAG